MTTRSKVDGIPTIQDKQPDQALNLPHGAPSRGLAAMFGLEMRTAVLAIVVDLMVFGVDTFSLETLIPLGVAVAAVLGVIVYKTQRKANDDHTTALIKAMTIGLLTAIPLPLTPLIAIPGGILGVLDVVRRK